MSRIDVALTLSDEVKEQILGGLNDIPPEIKGVLLTPDQCKHWQETRGIYQERHPDPKTCRVIGAMAYHYLSFYNLAFWAWEDITKDAPADYPKSPSEAVLTMMGVEADAILSPAFAVYDSWTPNAARSLRKEYLASGRIRAGRNTPNPIEALQIEKFRAKLKRDQQNLAKLKRFGDNVLKIAEANRKTNPEIDTALKNYLTARASLEMATAATFHPNAGMRGTEWRNGSKREI
jgi:hypothetical protein